MARIAIWTASHLPEVGGLQWSTFRLAKALVRLGHEPLFITRSLEDGSAWIPDLPEMRFPGRTVNEWTSVSGSWILGHRNQFDVLHAVDLFYQAVDEQLRFLSASGLPTVMKIPTQGCVPRIITTTDRRTAFSRIGAFAVLNAGIADELIEAGIPIRRIHPIPNGVDADEFVPAPDQASMRSFLDLPRSGVLVLYAGRFVQRKRLDVLLSAVQELPGSVTLVLVGSGFGQRDSVEAEVTERSGNARNVIVRGPTPQALPYFQACDVQVLLSEREGLANSLIEGMSCGLASVVSDVPGLSDVITNGRDGFVVPVGDIPAMVHALKWLCAEMNLRKRMGREARQAVLNRFEITNVARAYEGMYRSIANEEGI